jgi:hypothetical protein
MHFSFSSYQSTFTQSQRNKSESLKDYVHLNITPDYGSSACCNAELSFFHANISWYFICGCWMACLCSYPPGTLHFEEENSKQFSQVIYHAYVTPLRHIPGPWYAKFTHLWLKVQVLGGRRVQYIHALHQIYGPIVHISPAEIAVADFDSFREIHRIKSGYLKSPWYQEFGPPGIFTMIDPHQHAKRRQLLARGFSKSYLRQNWEPMVKEKAETAVEKIKRDAQRGTADILKWWTFYTTDTVSQLSFGESFHMLEQEEVNPLSRLNIA